MSIGLLLITHNRIGAELLDTARSMLGDRLPLATQALAVNRNCDPDRMLDSARTMLAELDGGDGVLVLTDAYGSTPSNIANRVGTGDRVAVVAGVNLPMLVRVLNYPELGLTELSRKACSGGRDGIVNCSEGEGG